MICRFGCVRMRQIPGSSASNRAASSNASSIAPKIGPCSAMRPIVARIYNPEMGVFEPLYTPDDLRDLDLVGDSPPPGQFPYTRGIHPDGYRGKLWTMRQFA